MKKQVARININDLAQVLVADLADLQKVGPVKSLEDLERVTWPKATATLLQNISAQLRAEQEKAEQQRLERLKERAEALERAVAQRQQRLEGIAEIRGNEVRRAAEGRFVAAGRIVDRDIGAGLPNVRVRAFDLDRKYDDLLRITRTDELGYYRIEYSETDFDELDKKPEMYIEVLDEEDRVLYTSSKSFIHKAGEVEVINVQLDGTMLPTSRALGEAVTLARERRIEGYKRRRQVLSARRPLGPTPVPAPLVDLNKATTEELTALPGIGPALAGAIKENRPYDTVDELLKVPGVGRHTLGRLKGHVTVSGS